MFLSSRFLRSVRYQPNSTTASLLINALMKPVCLGRFRPMILLFNRPNIPSILGIGSTRQSHSLGTGGRRHSSSAAGGKKGGGIQKGGSGGNNDQFGKGDAGNGRGGDGKSVSGESKDGSYQTVSPATIQVYSDPTLARTVRELSVVLQRLRNQLKNLKEDVEDTAFELLKQGQNQATLDKVFKEACTLSSESSKAVKEQTRVQTVMEKNLEFFSRMSASHDNQIRDSILRLNECDRRLEVALSKLDYVSSSLRRVKRLVTEDVKGDLQELRLAIKIARNETRNIKNALVREGIVVHSSHPIQSSKSETLKSNEVALIKQE
eukprot:XP_011674674.1 PREDICTED: uncharacterized protein LOC105443329 [Strongylocentrotus purpuratus]